MFNREIVMYLICGVGAAVVNLSLFHLFLAAGVDYKIGNFVAIVCGKVFAYISNKAWVFKTHSSSYWELLKEVFRFTFFRGFTGLIDYFGLILAVEVFGFNSVMSKYTLIVMVIVLNYFFSKKIVFLSIEHPPNNCDKSKNE